MRRCLELARGARATGDTAVGSLVVRHGDVLAEGVESVVAHHDVTAHAEIEAIRMACTRLRGLDLNGCTLYTTVEPCVMCAYAIRLARIGVVVSGARSPDADAAWSGWHVLTTEALVPRRPCPRVVRDVLADACLAVLNHRA